jgi:hypothetical protein
MFESLDLQVFCRFMLKNCFPVYIFQCGGDVVLWNNGFSSVILYISACSECLRSKCAGDSMSRIDWACLVAVILGFVLFIIGANVYNAVVGWVGVYFFFGGILVFLVRYIYGELTKKEEVQPVQNP